jgi:disulfide oxidoreductase YuzD
MISSIKIWKLIKESQESEKTYPGEEIGEYVRDISQEGAEPDYFIDAIINKRTFVKKEIDLKSLLNDSDFKEYYESGEERYVQDELSYDNLMQPIVVVDGKVLDGYSRASELLRADNDTIEAYVAI